MHKFKAQRLNIVFLCKVELALNVCPSVCVDLPHILVQLVEDLDKTWVITHRLVVNLLDHAIFPLCLLSDKAISLLALIFRFTHSASL